MLGLAILFAFQFIGLLIQKILQVPLPANVIGMILFTISLFAGWIKLQWVETASEFLIRHMMLFFLPFVVGVITLNRFMAPSELLPVVLSFVLSTIAALLVSGWVTKLMLGKGKSGREAKAGGE